MSQQTVQVGLTSYILQDNEKEMGRMLDDMQNKIIHFLKKTIGDQDINFTGDMTKSIKKENTNGVHFVTIDSPYAHLVDKGLSPGTWVNYDSLKKWVYAKIGITEEPELTDVTWKIMRKIQRDGIKPKRFVKKAIKEFIGKYGVSSIRRIGGGGKRSGFTKALNKINRIIKKLNKIVRAVSNPVVKANRTLRRYK